MKKRYAARLSYDGQGYCGFQKQNNADSIQEAIEKSLSIVLGEVIEIVGCGRTDAGVHAKDYVIHFDVEQEDPVSKIHNINGVLGEKIAIHNINPVGSDFHARFDAIERRYEYRIHLNKNPFVRDWSFYLKGSDQYDIKLLEDGASLMTRYSDFYTFCKTDTDVKTTVCKIDASEWHFSEYEWTYHISADRFLRGMVRLIVGTLLNVSRGKLSLEELKKTLDNRQKIIPAWSVPAHGLYLTRIIYP